MEEQAVLTWAAVTTILGIVLPPLMALVKRGRLAKRTQDVVILGILIVIGGVASFLVGDINPLACSNAELTVCLATAAAYIGAVVVQANTWYKMYWEDSKVENKIAGTA